MFIVQVNLSLLQFLVFKNEDLVVPPYFWTFTILCVCAMRVTQLDTGSWILMHNKMSNVLPVNTARHVRRNKNVDPFLFPVPVSFSVQKAYQCI